MLIVNTYKQRLHPLGTQRRLCFIVFSIYRVPSMYTCTFIYIYTCVCIHIHIHIHIHAHICMYIHTSRYFLQNTSEYNVHLTCIHQFASYSILMCIAHLQDGFVTVWWHLLWWSFSDFRRTTNLCMRSEVLTKAFGLKR